MNCEVDKCGDFSDLMFLRECEVAMPRKIM